MDQYYDVEEFVIYAKDEKNISKTVTTGLGEHDAF